MVPAEFLTYFSSMAAVGATLFGLIFVVISIAPESFATESAPLEKQVKAFTAYSALLNPLIISLFALVPLQQIGTFAFAMSLFGIINTLVVALTLLKASSQRDVRFRNSAFILLGFVLYGYETFFAARLLRSPSDRSALISLADMLVAIYVFGVIRAWELVGIRRFHLRDLFSFRSAPKAKEKPVHSNKPDKGSGEKSG